jgi:hypothetical protein
LELGIDIANSLISECSLFPSDLYPLNFGDNVELSASVEETTSVVSGELSPEIHLTKEGTDHVGVVSSTLSGVLDGDKLQVKFCAASSWQRSRTVTLEIYYLTDGGQKFVVEEDTITITTGAAPPPPSPHPPRPHRRNSRKRTARERYARTGKTRIGNEASPRHRHGIQDRAEKFTEAIRFAGD